MKVRCPTSSSSTYTCHTNPPLVHQERDPWTLEPLGNYRISFASHAAAIVYQSKLDRVFRLAQLKMRSKTGLWTNSVPSNLRGPASISPEEEVDAFTITPGSLAPSANRINARLSRVKGKWPWQNLVNELVRRSGFTVEPAVVLLHMHHSAISAADLQSFIDADGKARNEPWATSKPYHLATTLHENQSIFARNTRVPLKEDHAFRQKLRNRFVIVCKSPDVAWRFIRSWNQRTLTKEAEGQTQRTVLTASFIEV
ncbi:hypothetical protein EDB81DRAFT_332084 [Dactylonectria macrodidyma]|uniref:Uncharacterized protein n=1 Tax=Dactylonectria macrodidyma TaxID=307937 RepID=A0A9P9JD09_9HYPO|nr:hypothetical protein EDB81DRAFT_332084 [Dactylonectria macrodidyma]